MCHLWRQVVLGDSSLWARITEISKEISINTEFIYQMLARARDAPLDIDIDPCQTRGSIVLLMISPHLSHTRKLRLHSLFESDFDGFRRICSQEAPALEHFTLNSSASSLSTSLELGVTTLFKGAPKLRTFSLYYVFIPWSLIPRGQLTHLEISLAIEASNYINPPHGNLNQLIDLLVNCSELKVLILESCLPSQLSEFSHGQTIDLPRLSRLGLGGSSSRITNLLKMLKLSSATALQLYCIFKNNTPYNDHWHSSLLPVVSAHFQRTAPIELKSLRITLSCRECRLSVIASTCSLITARICQSLDFRSDVYDNGRTFLELFELPEHGHWTDLIEQLCKMLPISNLEVLSISAPDFVDSVNWVEVLKRCTTVSTVEIIGRGASSLVWALTQSTSAQKHTPIFLNLASLSLKEFNFAEDEHPSGILFDVVQKGLRQRMVECRALKVLHIESCTIGSKRAKALRGLVLTFQWDEMDIFNKPDSHDSDSDERHEPALWEEFFDASGST